MKLNIGERLNLAAILPEQGTIATAKMVRKLREALAFQEDEFAEFELRLVIECPEHKVPVEIPAQSFSATHCDKCGAEMYAKRWKWNPDKDAEKEIPMGEIAHEEIKKILKRMDSEQKLGSQHITLYEKFVGD